MRIGTVQIGTVQIGTVQIVTVRIGVCASMTTMFDLVHDEVGHLFEGDL
jgi:hypothetical protein